MTLTKQDVYDALRSCRDPEIPVNIVDLGLIYEIEIHAAEDGASILVKMTLTSASCPMSHAISAEVQKRLLQLDSVRQARVEIVWEPAWNPSMITEAGKRELQLV